MSHLICFLPQVIDYEVFLLTTKLHKMPILIQYKNKQQIWGIQTKTLKYNLAM